MEVQTPHLGHAMMIWPPWVVLLTELSYYRYVTPLMGFMIKTGPWRVNWCKVVFVDLCSSQKQEDHLKLKKIFQHRLLPSIHCKYFKHNIQSTTAFVIGSTLYPIFRRKNWPAIEKDFAPIVVV